MAGGGWKVGLALAAGCWCVGRPRQAVAENPRSSRDEDGVALPVLVVVLKQAVLMMGRGVDRGPRRLRSWSLACRCRYVGRPRLTVSGRIQISLLAVGWLVGVLVFMLTAVAHQTCRRTPSAFFAYWRRGDDPLSTGIKVLYYIDNKSCTVPGRSHSTQKRKSCLHPQNSDQRINQYHHLNLGKSFVHSEDKQHLTYRKT
jgi:hypothetical protein